MKALLAELLQESGVQRTADALSVPRGVDVRAHLGGEGIARSTPMGTGVRITDDESVVFGHEPGVRQGGALDRGAQLVGCRWLVDERGRPRGVRREDLGTPLAVALGVDGADHADHYPELGVADTEAVPALDLTKRGRHDRESARDRRTWTRSTLSERWTHARTGRSGR
jgi:hypothetical protein